MQVSNVSNSNCNVKNYNRNNRQPQNQTFGNGLANGLVSTIAFIENNGFAGEFFTVDGLGMMGPRTVQAYTRNRKELGHLNYKAGAEEAIREFLTGPSMFLIPVSFMLLSGKLFGRASKLNVNTLKEFGKVSKEVLKNSENVPKFKTNFYDKALTEMFSHHSKKADANGHELISKTKKEIIETLEKLEASNLKKAEKKKLKGEIDERVVHMNHFFDISTREPRLLNIGGEIEVKNGLSEFKKGSTKISSEMVDDLLNFANDKDIQKISSKTPEEAVKFLDKTIDNKQGIRKIMTVTAFSSVGAFLYAIPLLYKRNKQFPGVDGLIEGQENEPMKKPFSKHKKEEVKK